MSSHRLACILAALLAAAAAGDGGAAQAQELTMGNVNPPRHGTSLASQQFIDRLAELSGGKIKVAHHHSGALGGEREVAQQVQLGAVDFAPVTTAPLSTLVPELSVFQLPYIFRDYEHVFKALDGSDTLTRYYDGVLDRKGLKLVGFAVWERRAGGRNVTFPSRQYSVNGDRRSFALLRPENGDASAQEAIREAILDAYSRVQAAS